MIILDTDQEQHCVICGNRVPPYAVKIVVGNHTEKDELHDGDIQMLMVCHRDCYYRLTEKKETK